MRQTNSICFNAHNGHRPYLWYTYCRHYPGRRNWPSIYSHITTSHNYEQNSYKTAAVRGCRRISLGITRVSEFSRNKGSTAIFAPKLRATAPDQLPGTHGTAVRLVPPSCLSTARQVCMYIILGRRPRYYCRVKT